MIGVCETCKEKRSLALIKKKECYKCYRKRNHKKVREYEKKYELTEKVRERKKRYYNTPKGTAGYKRRIKKWRAENRERCLENRRRWYYEHRKEQLLYAKEYRAKKKAKELEAKE